MNQREKRLAMIFGTAIGCAALYYAVDLIYIAPVKTARKEKESLLDEKAKLEDLVASEVMNAERWRSFANRTFSKDDDRSFDYFGQALKETAARFGFTTPDIRKIIKRTSIGSKTDIKYIQYEVSVKADYIKVVRLLRGFYDSPYVSQVTNVTMTPDPNEGRNIVRLDCRVATPILPEISRKESSFAAGSKTMEAVKHPPTDSWRRDILPAAVYDTLADRNIFKAFEPAPRNQVIVDNPDLKLVGLEATFTWEGKESTVQQTAVQPGKQVTIFGEGDMVELRGVYADGKEFKQKHSFQNDKPWAYRIAKHTPQDIDHPVTVMVDNQDDKEARFQVTLVHKDGKSQLLPDMLVAAGANADLGSFNDMSQVRIQGTYASGKLIPQRTFTPSATTHTYLIPMHTEEVVETDPIENETPVVVNDPPPCDSCVVKALLTYEDVDGEYAQEMIIEGPEGREIIRSGQYGKVDGGVLRGVCPLGGIVFMPDSGNYYLYPRGASFSDRTLLSAKTDEQLASAIKEWARGPAAIGG